MKTEPIRAGFIGLGGFGAARRKWVRESGRFDIAGGFDVDQAAIDAARSEEGSAFVPATSVEQLVGREDVEIVFICTPAHLHLEHAFAAAQAGKHIFVEKPLGHDLNEARKLVRFCDEHRLVLGVGFTARHRPGAIACKRHIDAGKLGTIVAADVVTVHCGGLIQPRDNWRFDPKHNPGGPLFHLGVHALDLLRWWLGPRGPVKVVAALSRSHEPSPQPSPGVPGEGEDQRAADAFTLLMRFGETGGVPVTLHSHYVCAYRHYAQIFGTAGNLYYEMGPPAREALWFQRQRGGEAEPRERIDLPAGSGETAAMVALADAMRGGARYEPDGEDGVAALEMIFDAVRLADEQRERRGHLS